MTPTDRYAELRPQLDAKKFIQQAREISGLSDYGDETFFMPLDKLLDCVSRDVNFHKVGLADFKAEVVRGLVNRLRFQDDTKRYPEILNENVSDPIIIIGLPRAGTTKTQRMMGVDPSLLSTSMWQTINPAPFPDAVLSEPDPRIAAAKQGDLILTEDTPGVDAGHFMQAELLEEHWELLEYTFNDWFQCNRTPSHSWSEWVLSRTEPADIINYRYLHTLIQYLQWQQGGRGKRRWLLKCCGHLAHIEELLEVFPNATLVHLHRHPAVSLPSWIKINVGICELRVADVDPKFVGSLMLEWEKFSMDRYLKTRDRLGLNDRIIDVPYDQIRTDPMPVIDEIYRRANHPLTLEAKERMRQWEKTNEQGKHGKHSYSLEQFGLSEKKINAAFGDYIQRFIHS